MTTYKQSKEYRKAYDSQPHVKAKREAYQKMWYESKGTEWHQEHYQRIKQRAAELQRARKATHPAKFMYTSIKSDAKKRGIPFTIELDDIVIPDYCPVLGIPIVCGSGKRTDNSPSLDKFIPELGYVKGNVAVISWKANRLKNNGTLDDFKHLVEWMEKR